MSGGRSTAGRRSIFGYIPSFISALRLPIAAAFFAVDSLTWRGILLSLGALTDAVDGWVARRFSLQSPVGAMLDPLFDKLFVVVALAAFLPGSYLSGVEFVVLISRDLYVGFGYLTARVLGVDVPAQARRSGKVVTFLQVVTLFVLLLAPERTGAFVVAVAVASGIAIIDYTATGIAALRERSRAV